MSEMMTELLTRDEETDLVEAARRGDDRARQTLIEKNIGLCWKVARNAPRPRWMDAEDLAYEGVLGLDHAIDRFDTQRGTKFSTYAMWWVRQAIQRKLEKTTYCLYTPTYIYDRIGRLGKARRSLHCRLQREPTLEEIAKESGYTREQILEVRPLELTTQSLEAECEEDGNLSLADQVADERDYAGLVEQAIWLKQCLDVLPEELREVLTLRYGLGDTPTMTLREVAKLKNVSRETIRKQEEKALSIMRAHVEGREDEL